MEVCVQRNAGGETGRRDVCVQKSGGVLFTSRLAKSTRPFAAARIHLSIVFVDASAHFASRLKGVPPFASRAFAHCMNIR